MIIYDIYLFNRDENGILIWSSETPEINPILAGKLELEVNAVYKFEFQIRETNEYADDITIGDSKIVVDVRYKGFDSYDIDSVTHFYGFVINKELNMNGLITITCEGFQGMLKNIYLDPKDAFDGCLQSRTEDSVKGIIEAMINRLSTAFHYVFRDESNNSPFWINLGNVYVDSNENYENLYYEILGSFNECEWMSFEDYLNRIIEKIGGFFYFRFERYYGYVVVSLDYYKFNYYNTCIPEAISINPNYHGLDVRTPNEDESLVIENDDAAVFPLFQFGDNIIDYTIEPSVSVDNMYTGIVPIGKEANVYITGGGYGVPKHLWYSDLVNKYGYRAKYMTFEEAETEEALETLASRYYNKVLSISGAKRYIIKAYEPMIYGSSGLVLTKLMHEARVIIGKHNVDYSGPVLSLSVDLLNPSVIDIVVGPYIPDNYLDDKSITR